MLMVLPRGSTKPATSLRAPSLSAASMVKGSVPTEEAEENAIIIAGIISLKNFRGETPPSVLMVKEYTTTMCTM